MHDNDNDSNYNYIGYTARSLKKRIPEHIKDIQNKASTTALAQRALISDLEVKWKEAKILIKEHNPTKGGLLKH